MPASPPDPKRWLVLIAYLMGLSIGVHLLNLLAIPAIVFIYYFKKTPKVTAWGVVKATLIAAAILLISCTLDCDFQIVNLLPQHGFLPLIRDWDTLKLGMTDDNRIIVSHSDSGTELFPVRRFKIFLGCHQDIGSRI